MEKIINYRRFSLLAYVFGALLLLSPSIGSASQPTTTRVSVDTHGHRGMKSAISLRSQRTDDMWLFDQTPATLWPATPMVWMILLLTARMWISHGPYFCRLYPI